MGNKTLTDYHFRFIADSEVFRRVANVTSFAKIIHYHRFVAIIRRKLRSLVQVWIPGAISAGHGRHTTQSPVKWNMRPPRWIFHFHSVRGVQIRFSRASGELPWISILLCRSPTLVPSSSIVRSVFSAAWRGVRVFTVLFALMLNRVWIARNRTANNESIVPNVISWN